MVLQLAGIGERGVARRLSRHHGDDR